MIVLDTNVLSELMADHRDDRVTAWVRRQRPGDLATTAICVAEIRFGIARLPAGRRRTSISAAAEKVFVSFGDRILPFDSECAAEYAHVVVTRQRTGRPISALDAEIAAICRATGSTLATRNVTDFDRIALTIVNPWTDE